MRYRGPAIAWTQASSVSRRRIEETIEALPAADFGSNFNAAIPRLHFSFNGRVKEYAFEED